MGIGVGCVVVAVIGGCRLWARLWLAEDMQCSIVIFAYVIVAVSMATNGFVAFVMYVCMSFIVTIIMVVNVMGIVVMVSDDGFVVGTVGIVAVGSCVFLVVVSVIADSFARHGCGFAIVCVCVWQWYWMHEAVDSTHWTVWPWLIEKLGWCLSRHSQCSVS